MVVNMVVSDNGSVTGPRASPSLYAAIRLASLVLYVKERFKSRIKARRQMVNPLTVYHHDNFEARAFEKINNALDSRSRSFALPQTGQEKPYVQKREISTLLHDLDSHTKTDGDSISDVAMQDQRFLRYDAQRATFATGNAELRHILDLTTLLLNRLQVLSSGYDSSSVDNHLKCEKFVANLEHLLRCLQQAAAEALVHNALKLLEADILHWHQYWQQRHLSQKEWFAEWPNGQPPLNTTWPWNVKPSLVILWGVCWKFFDNVTNTRMTRVPFRNRTWLAPDLLSENYFPNTDPLSFTDSSPETEAENWINTNTYPNPPLDSAWPPSTGDRANTSYESHDALSQDLARARNSSTVIPRYLVPNYSISTSEDPYISPSSDLDLDLDFDLASATRLRPCIQRDRVIDGQCCTFSNGQQLISQHQHQQHQHQYQPQTLPVTRQGTEPQGEVQPYVPRYQPVTSFPDIIGNIGPRSSLKVPRQDMPDSSSHGDISTQDMSSSPSRYGPSPGGPYAPSSSTIESLQPRQDGSVRSIDPARNENGLLCCFYPHCTVEPRVFSRKCEYTKHMDKHNRPYVCEEPECENIQGFTYSGGLLRHQREVHRQHGGPKASCVCPYRDCKRSVGRGFSRKENLSEHLRRVHRGVGGEQDSPPPSLLPLVKGTAVLASASSKCQPAGGAGGGAGNERKRKRESNDDNSDDDDDDNDDDDNDNDNDQTDRDDDNVVGAAAHSSGDLQRQINRLRKEVKQKAERLRKLELVVQRLASGQRVTTPG